MEDKKEIVDITCFCECVCCVKGWKVVKVIGEKFRGCEYLGLF